MALKKQFLKSKPVCKVTFSFPEEAIDNGAEIRVLGEFNDWNWDLGTPMKLSKGHYKAVIPLEKDHRFQFKYLIDGNDWKNDWDADAYESNPFGVENSVVTT